MSKTKVPESFATPEEEARFWDETDLTDLASGELEEVEMRRPSKPLSSTFAIRLDQQSVAMIRKIARARGIGPTQLARAWILDRLRMETRAGELANPEADEEELEIRRAVMDEVAAGIPDLVAAGLVAAGLGAMTGKAISKAKKRRDARVAAATRARETSASVSEQRRESKDASA